MNRICFLIFYFLVLFQIENEVIAQREKRIFERLTIENGLPSNIVSSLYLDKKGFLWVSTNDAISRYDGYGFLNLRNDPFDSTSLPPGHGTKIYQEKNLNLFIQSTNDKISQLDPVSKKFTPSKFPNLVNYSIPPNPTIDSNGDYYAYHYDAGLALINIQSGEISKIDYKGMFNNIKIKFIVRFLPDVIVCATKDSKLFLYSESKRTITPIFKEISGRELTTIYVRKNGNLVLGFPEGILLEMNIFSKKIEKHKPIKNSKTLRFSKIAEDSYSTLWIGSNNGLISYNTSSGQSHQFVHDPNDPQSISDNLIPTLLIDSNNVLWASSVRGLNKTIISVNKFHTKPFGFQPGFKTFLDDGKGNIWLGSPKKGLIVLPKETDYVRSLHQKKNFIFKENENILHFKTSMSLLKKTDKKVWMGTFFDGIYEFDIESKSYRKKYGTADGLPSLSLTSMFKDSKNRIWASTDSGISIFDENTGNFKSAYKVLQDTSIRQIESARVIYEDRFGTFWFGTTYNGLFEYIENQSKTIQHKHDPKNFNSLSSNWIYSIAEDSLGNLWVGTSSGLNRINKETSLIDHFTTKDGLPSNSVLVIVNDQIGNLWCGTINGLFKYNIKSNTTRIFQTPDGLEENSFLAGSGYSAADGTLFFGQTGGFLYFNPKDFNEIESPSSLTFTNFEKNGKQENIGIDYFEENKIIMYSSESFFSLEFSELDYISPNSIKYAYQLEGANSEWIQNGFSRKITFANLEPGDYKLKVKSTDRNGNWHSSFISAQIEIIPEYWQTNWFKGFIFIIILFLISGLFLYRISRIRQMEKVRWQIAGDLHDEVGGTLSSMALRIHHFLGIAKNINPNEEKQLSNIADKAVETVYKIDDIVWSINPQNDNLEDMIYKIKDITSEFLSNHNMKYQFSIGNIENSRKLNIETKKNIVLVYKEIINNIIKHSGASQVDVIVKYEKNELYLSVSDNGKGFDSTKISETNNGFGLSNQEKRAKEIGGSIIFTSKINEGTKVDFRLKL